MKSHAFDVFIGVVSAIGLLLALLFVVLGVI